MPKLERIEIDGSLRSLNEADAKAYRATGATYNREVCPTCGGSGKVAPGGGDEASTPTGGRGGRGNAAGAGTTSPAAGEASAASSDEGEEGEGRRGGRR